jgi:hypothetical protein
MSHAHPPSDLVSASGDERVRALLGGLGIDVSDDDLAEVASIARHLLAQAERLSGPLPLQLEPLPIQLPSPAPAGDLK